MIPFHPLANLFPMFEPPEFEELVRDIRATGLRELIMLIDEGSGSHILDGRNRYRAMLEAGLIGEDDADGLYFRKFVPAIDGDPLSYVLSKNLARRHLNESQRAMVAARLGKLAHGRPWVSNKPAGLPVLPQPRRAQALNVSERLVRDADVVQENGTDELKNAVDRGKLTVTAARQASKLTPQVQHEVVKAADEAKANVVRTVVKQQLRAAREAELGARQMALPDKQYGIILADPEWEFVVFSKVTGMDRSPANHYPTNPTQEIAARDVQKLAAKDCMLALWSPASNLERALNVMRSWSFEFKTLAVWVKDFVSAESRGFTLLSKNPMDIPPGGATITVGHCRHAFMQIGPPGLGYWFRDRAEILLIGTRGEFPAPAPGTQIESVIFAARPKIEGTQRGKHSAKPDDVHRWIESNWPHLPKIELNARARRAGWDSWGNELPDQPVAEEAAPAEAEDAEPFPEEDEERENRASELADSNPSTTLSDEPFEIPAFLRRKREDALP